MRFSEWHGITFGWPRFGHLAVQSDIVSVSGLHDQLSLIRNAPNIPNRGTASSERRHNALLNGVFDRRLSEAEFKKAMLNISGHQRDNFNEAYKPATVVESKRE
jgi:hypothetical protein